MAVPTAEEGAEVEGDACIVGERDDSSHLHLAAPAASRSPERVRSTAEQKKWEAALAEWKDATVRALAMREIANREVVQRKNAQRLHDAKMKRLDAGDKRGRRKSSFGAARRTYEAIIELLQAEHKCESSKCRAAEAELTAAKAEIRLMELE